MHLAGEADAGDFFRTDGRFMKSFFYGDAAGSPPIARILFGPTGLGRSELLVHFRAGGHDPAGTVHQQRASAASTNVNAEEVDADTPIAENTCDVRRGNDDGL
jgi:hypothetical protein